MTDEFARYLRMVRLEHTTRALMHQLIGLTIGFNFSSVGVDAYYHTEDKMGYIDKISIIVTMLTIVLCIARVFIIARAKDYESSSFKQQRTALIAIVVMGVVGVIGGLSALYGYNTNNIAVIRTGEIYLQLLWQSFILGLCLVVGTNGLRLIKKN